MQHLDDGLIQELIDGEIPSQELGPLQLHLAGCEPCRARLDAARSAAGEADELLLLLDEVAPAPPRAAPEVQPIPRPHWSRNLAWAASLVLAVGLGYAGRDVLNPILPSRVPDQGVTAERQPATGASAPDAERPTTGAAPADPNVAAPVTQPGTAAASARVNPAAPEPRRDQAGAPAREQALPPAAPVASGSGNAVAADLARQVGRVAETEVADPTAERRAESALSAQRNRARPPAAFQPLQSADAAKSTVAAHEVQLPAALQLLGGSIKLIEGMVPERLDAAGDEVMVVYRVRQGELLLVQRRVSDSLTWRLAPPPGFPADSLAVLRGMVRP